MHASAGGKVGVTPAPGAGVAATPSNVTGEMGRGLASYIDVVGGGLGSVKRDLNDEIVVPGSASSAGGLPPAPKRRQFSRSELGELGLRVHGAAHHLPRDEQPGGAAAYAVSLLPSLELKDGGMAPSLFEGLPSLDRLRLPPVVESRLLSQRAWLQRLLEDELHRAQRGGYSSLEAACGVPPPTSPPPNTMMAVAAVLLKFEAERGQLLSNELLEIGSLQAAGKALVSA